MNLIQIIKIRCNGFFDPETGFFTYIFDNKCFEKKHRQRAKILVPKMDTSFILEESKHAYQMHPGYAEEMLIELAIRYKNDIKQKDQCKKTQNHADSSN